MVAGPILRAKVLLPQFQTRTRFDPNAFSDGLTRIFGGLFLKVVLADSIAPYVDDGFSRNPAELSFFDSWTLAFLFGFQIYFDFAGYSHIAIGSAKLLGINLPENFNFPYFATSPRDFWQRWHISLSTWVRDYLYLPIMGTFRSARDDAWNTVSADDGWVSVKRRALALFSTWIIMGFWHGANWTFALWGFYHAALIQGQRMLAPIVPVARTRLLNIGGIAVTLPLTMAGWVPFRCGSIRDTLSMWTSMIDVRGASTSSLQLPINFYLVAAFLTITIFFAQFVSQLIGRWAGQFRSAILVLATILNAAAIALVVVFLESRTQFIYFQF
jgi:D-alanyl-lipoteichoic acid acyltransferase DltB (MBOAT superfamily)